MISSEFFECGKVDDTRLLRYKSPDLSKSGVVSTFAGGLLTARHVVIGQKIPGFSAHTLSEMDIAFKPDPNASGLPLGWVDVYGLDHVELATTSLQQPDKVVRIAGRVGLYLLATDLHYFRPYDYDVARPFMQPGVSGSPLIYKDHIIGIVAARFAQPREEFDKESLVSVVFNAWYMRDRMTEFGLSLSEQSLASINS